VENTGRTFECVVCGDVRPVSAMGVFKRDISKRHGAREGTMLINVKFCSDREYCSQHADLTEGSDGEKND